MKTSINSLKARAETALADARALTETAQAAAGRNLTDAEQRQFDAKLADARRAAQEIRKVKTADDLARQAKAFTEQVGMPIGSGDDSLPTESRLHGSSWAKSAAATVQRASGQLGIKALTSGSIDIPSVVESEVIRLGETPRRVLDLVTTMPVSGNAYAFLRQTVRSTLAAFTADAQAKPVSTYTVTEVEDRVRVPRPLV
jgi:HK97 family phage major capsid protein